MWELKTLDEFYHPKDDFSDDKKTNDASRVMKGKTSGVSKSIISACKIFRSSMQRIVLELLLLSEDCKQSEIPGITGIKPTVIKDYIHIFFRYKDAFDSRLDIIDYIETGLSNSIAKDSQEEVDEFLYKRWALNMGKDFVIWRFRLKPVDYDPSELYKSVTLEAFFYHKERSMGKDDISVSEYLRSAKAVLDSIKAGMSISEKEGGNEMYDMREELDIIIKEKKPPEMHIGDMGGEFINNG